MCSHSGMGSPEMLAVAVFCLNQLGANFTYDAACCSPTAQHCGIDRSKLQFMTNFVWSHGLRSAVHARPDQGYWCTG